MRRDMRRSIVIALVSSLWLAVATGGARAEGEWRVVDGDAVIWVDEGDVGIAAAGPVVTPYGYSLFAGFGEPALHSSYTIRLVSSPGIEQLRPFFESAAFVLSFMTGVAVSVAPGTVLPADSPGSREILASVSSTSPCTGGWVGCGGPRGSESDGTTRYVRGGMVWIHPTALSYTIPQLDHVIRHELGHALALAHYDFVFESAWQIMHSSRYDATSYQTGDQNGLRTFALRGLQGFVSSPFGNFEAARRSMSGVRVVGWAIDPDTTASLWVQVSVGGSSTAFLAGGARPDVAAEHPGFGPNHGFDLDLPVALGTHSVCVTAQDVGTGIDTSLGCRSITVSNAPFGKLNAVTRVPGGVQVRGWAIDPNTSDAINVDAYVGSTGHDLGFADLFRAHLASDYPDYGGNHGYDAFVPATHGTRDVCVYGIDQGAGSANTQLGCRSVVISGDPFGSFERVILDPIGAYVSGWAIDPDTPAAVRIDVSIDGGPQVDIGPAQNDRLDVADEYPAYGSAHGFAAAVAMPSGTHQVCVYARNRSSAGSERLLGCRSLTSPVNPWGNFETIRFASGGIRATGWTIDGDTTAATSVALELDGVLALWPTANQTRNDVAGSYPRYGAKHGFDAVIPATRAQHTVCAHAINKTGAGGNTPLGCKTILADGTVCGLLGIEPVLLVGALQLARRRARAARARSMSTGSGCGAAGERTFGRPA